MATLLNYSSLNYVDRSDPFVSALIRTSSTTF
jgi:hypothetical protein